MAKQTVIGVEERTAKQAHHFVECTFLRKPRKQRDAKWRDGWRC